MPPCPPQYARLEALHSGNLLSASGIIPGMERLHRRWVAVHQKTRGLARKPAQRADRLCLPPACLGIVRLPFFGMRRYLLAWRYHYRYQ